MSWSYDQAVARWASQWREEHLSEEVRLLIRQATTDLMAGPFRDGSFGDPTEGDDAWDNYPGFVRAVETVRRALRDARPPRQLYLDVDTGHTQEREPQPEVCTECAGTGAVGPDEHKVRCQECGGRCSFEPAGDWYHLESQEVWEHLVGQNLVPYLSP